MPITGFAADARVLEHVTVAGHPEQPARFSSVVNQLKSTGLMERLRPVAARRASDDELTLAHTSGYLALVEREIGEGRNQLSTGDTAINKHSSEVARVATGCALASVDAVFAGDVDNAFCAVRPPGHHANATRGMGFCVFNHVAVAARYAQRKYGIERVLIADWDVHHGNGTQDIFYDDESVLFFSTHQSPWYPGTGASNESGAGEGSGKTINCPFPAGTGSSSIFQAFREKLLPAAQAFRPELILISAGFDSRVGDPLGQFLLTDDDFRVLTCLMTDLAAKYSGGKLVSVLEGGYALRGLALASESHVRGLLGEG